MRVLPLLVVGCGALYLAACGATPQAKKLAPSQLSDAALLSASCSGCHADGGSPGGIGSLDGMTAEALQTKLLAYRNDPGGGSAMHRMARGYTDAQIAIIATYLGD